jgi:hypothetical protein
VNLAWIALILSATIWPAGMIIVLVMLVRERREHRSALAERAAPVHEGPPSSVADVQLAALIKTMTEQAGAEAKYRDRVITLLQNIPTSCGAGAIAAELGKSFIESAKLSAMAGAEAAQRVINGPPSVNPARAAGALPPSVEPQGESMEPAPPTVPSKTTPPAAGNDPVVTFAEDPEATTLMERPVLPPQSRPAPGPRRSPTLLGIGIGNAAANGSDQTHPMGPSARTHCRPPRSGTSTE